MQIGIIKERRLDEMRVAATPDTIKKFIAMGLQVNIERGAGITASITDQEYEEAGANLLENASKVLENADIVLKVGKPIGPKDEDASKLDEVKLLKSGSILVSLMEPYKDRDLIDLIAKQNVTCFALELIPRITRAQTMDVLSSQSNLAGYKAVIEASTAYGKAFPMMMTAAGTIPPSKVLVIGAGVAGLQAIATSKRLGANVEAFDVRDAAAEQVESLGAKFLKQESLGDAEDKGGYAREQTDDEKLLQKEFIKSNLTNIDALITTAAIPGKKAPIIITKDMVENMKPGSVIIDLSAESGGNVELTKPGEIINHNNVSIHGPINVPSSMAFHASQLYSRNVMGLLDLIVNESKEIELDLEDEIIKSTCINFSGKASD